MSIQEYIKNNRPFYHVTKESNIQSILESGLKKGRYGICVVRNIDYGILDEIIRQINVDGVRHFAVIEILPQKHDITADIVCEDGVDEPTAPLQNYIVMDKIAIEEDEIIIRNYEAKYNEGFDENKIAESRLTDYTIPSRPKYEEPWNEFDDC